MKFLTPIFYTKKLQESIDFYTKYLQFKCVEQEQNWAFLEFEDIAIMFSLPNTDFPFIKPTYTGLLYFHCDDVDVIWDFVKDDVKICYPIKDFDYGMREFAIYDNNGYMLQFGAPIEKKEKTEDSTENKE